MPMAESDRKDWLWLALILVLALALRLPGLDGPLWYDEILTVDTHLRLPWAEMMRDYSMNHHYLHDVFAKAAIMAFGEHSWSIRLPALVFGLAGIAAVWWLARDIAGRRVALGTALLMALSFHQIWFSQNARGYTGIAFFSTVGLILFLRGLDRPRALTWIGFGLAMAAAVFTHLTAIFFFAGLGLLWLWVLVRRWHAPNRPRLVAMPLLGAAVGATAILVAYLPILPGILEAARTVSDTSAVDVMKEYQNPLWTVAEALRTALGSAGPKVLAVGGVVLTFVVLGAVRLARRAPLFAPAVGLHILLTVGILLAIGGRIWPRFFFPDIGFLLVLIVAGLDLAAEGAARLIGRPAWRAGLFALALGLAAMVSALLAARNYSAPKQDLAGSFALAEASRRPGERIYALGPAATVFRDHFKAGWGAIEDDASYRAALAQPGPVTLVVAFPGRVLREIPSLAADRDRALSVLREFPGTLGDGDVLVLRRD